MVAEAVQRKLRGAAIPKDGALAAAPLRLAPQTGIRRAPHSTCAEGRCQCRLGRVTPEPDEPRFQLFHFLI